MRPTSPPTVTFEILIHTQCVISKMQVEGSKPLSDGGLYLGGSLAGAQATLRLLWAMGGFQSAGSRGQGEEGLGGFRV